MDNAATSFPKPRSVHQAMSLYATQSGASPGRGGYLEAREIGGLIQECRTRLCDLIHGERAQSIIVLKRSMRPGFAGVDNDLYYDPKCMMLFGDAKESLNKLFAALKM